MKKFYLLGAAGLLLAFSSCSKDSYHEVSTTYYASSLTIVTSVDEGNVTVIPGVYAFNVEVVNDSQTVSVASPGELIADNTALSFVTSREKYLTTGNDIFVANVTGTVGNTGMNLNKATFLACNPIDSYFSYGYYNDLSDIGDYTFQIGDVGRIAVAQYNIGDSFKVNTFPETSFFKGTTKTTYSANPNGFQTEDITYRFSIYYDNDNKEYLADMILYNARFAEEMPMSLAAVLVKGLNVEFNPDNVTITGENIIPYWYTNSAYQELARYIFKSVTFETTNSSYTDAKLIYEVGTDYVGEFEGSYGNFYFDL